MRRAKVTTRCRRRGDAAGDPCGNGQSDGQRDEAGPESFAAEQVQAVSPAVCSTKRRKTSSITSGVEGEQEDEKPEQLGEDFGVMKAAL